MLAFFSGCEAEQKPDEDSSPQIVQVEFSCDRELDQWILRLDADGWTDGGDVVMATENRIEIHTMDSIRARLDGSADELLMQLSIEASPDDAVSGRASGFLCTETQQAELSMRVAIYDYDSDEAESDCWEWGPEKDFSPWDYAPCERVEPPESARAN